MGQPNLSLMETVRAAFATENSAGFLAALTQSREKYRRAEYADSTALAEFAADWIADKRPWARAQLFAYLDQPLDCPGHQGLVKRLFKAAEANRDHELMGAFLVAFDRSIRRKRVRVSTWDSATRTMTPGERLGRKFRPLPGVLPAENKRRFWFNGGGPGKSQLFSAITRRYLQRRCWRYFRRLGIQQSQEYVNSVCNWLRRFRDADLQAGEDLLDSWALVHACFGQHPSLIGKPHRVELQPGAKLAGLTPAPDQPTLWQDADAAEELLDLFTTAHSRLVRQWASQLLERIHVPFLRGLEPERLLPLLQHEDEQISLTAVQWFARLPGVSKLPLKVWLAALACQHPPVLQALTDLFLKHVSPTQLGLERAVELTTRMSVAVAQMGFNFLHELPPQTNAERKLLVRLADTKCTRLAGSIATWALGYLGEPDVYDRDQVAAFFDSVQEPTRSAAWAWLMAGGAGFHDPVLWSRLLETPFSELRLRLVDALDIRAQRTAPHLADDLVPIWTAVLLGIERGGKQKLRAIRQLGTKIVEQPAQADLLLPVMAVALRSLRGPESRLALTVLMQVLEERPELADVVQRLIPELELPAEEPSSQALEGSP